LTLLTEVASQWFIHNISTEYNHVVIGQIWPFSIISYCHIIW